MVLFKILILFYIFVHTYIFLIFFNHLEDNEELKAKRIDAFRKRCKKIKQSLNLRALKHESSILSGKEISSTNKLKLQKLCMELDKQLIPQIKDYSQLENYLKEISKILEGRKEADLHIMRQLKFIPLLMEICKKITY